MTPNDQKDRYPATWLGDNDQPTIPADLVQALDDLYGAEPNEHVLQQALARLDRSMDAVFEQVLYIDIVPDTLLGEIFLAVNRHGLMAVNFGVTQSEFIAQLKRLSPTVLLRTNQATVAAEQMREYLDGRRSQFDIPVDLSALTEFQRRVLQATTQIRRGDLVTYADLAARIGRPRAYRAVGQALGRNPVPIVIPCHRVIASDGSLGGYSGGGGLRSKSLLLDLEGASVQAH